MTQTVSKNLVALALSALLATGCVPVGGAARAESPPDAVARPSRPVVVTNGVVARGMPVAPAPAARARATDSLGALEAGSTMDAEPGTAGARLLGPSKQGRTTKAPATRSAQAVLAAIPGMAQNAALPDAANTPGKAASAKTAGAPVVPTPRPERLPPTEPRIEPHPWVPVLRDQATNAGGFWRPDSVPPASP